MPKRRKKDDGVLVGVFDPTNGNYTYEIALGMTTFSRNGERLPIQSTIDGVFAIISTDLPGVESWVALSLNTPYTQVRCDGQRIGLINEADEHFSVWDEHSNQTIWVPKNGFRQHALVLIGAFLFWKHLIRNDLVEQPTH